MTYLTQTIIDSRTVARDLRLYNTYDWHQFAWRAFGNKDKRDFLTRIDRRRDGCRLLILSADQPQCPDTRITNWDTRRIPDQYLSHRRFLFQIRANPTRRDSATQKRVCLFKEDALVNWICRKAGESGFVVDEDSLQINREGGEFFRIRRRREFGLHVSVDFRAILTVTDRKQFTSAFRNGIGRAKAFGFGMLCLKAI